MLLTCTCPCPRIVPCPADAAAVGGARSLAELSDVLLAARYDVSQLSTLELLRWDYKQGVRAFPGGGDGGGGGGGGDGGGGGGGSGEMRIGIAAICEMRFGTLRFVTTFLFVALGGNFLGALTDSACDVYAGESAVMFGLLAMYWAEHLLDAQHRSRAETCVAVAMSAISFTSLIAIGKSPATSLGGFILGLTSAMLFMPHFTHEKVEAAAPYFAAALLIIFFVILPTSYYGTVGDPACLLGPEVEASLPTTSLDAGAVQPPPPPSSPLSLNGTTMPFSPPAPPFTPPLLPA